MEVLEQPPAEETAAQANIGAEDGHAQAQKLGEAAAQALYAGNTEETFALLGQARAAVPPEKRDGIVTLAKATETTGAVRAWFPRQINLPARERKFS